MTETYDINRHIYRYLKDEPFYAALSRHINKQSCESIPTAGVCIDPNSGTFILLYNPNFVSSLNDNEIKLLLKHEFMHLILDHVTSRMPAKTHIKMWNHATDLAINSEIFPKNIDISIEKLYKMCLLPGKEGPYKDFPSNQSAEFYFAKIKELVET